MLVPAVVWCPLKSFKVALVLFQGNEQGDPCVICIVTFHVSR